MSEENCSKECNGCGTAENSKPRPRKATLLNMQWLRERLQKAQAIKEKLESGAYQVNSEALAKAVLNDEKSK